MAAIQKRGPNTYRVTVSCGYGRDGKKLAKRKTFTINDDLTPKQQEKEINRVGSVI